MYTDTSVGPEQPQDLKRTDIQLSKKGNNVCLSPAAQQKLNAKVHDCFAK